jgi:hypothetical protein
MSTTTIVVSADATTHFPAAGARVVAVDPAILASDPEHAIARAEHILTLPDGERLGAALNAPPSGAADPQQLAMTRVLLDAALGFGGLDEAYRIVPAAHDGTAVLLFAEHTAHGALALGELWPARERYSSLVDADASEPDADRAAITSAACHAEQRELALAIFPRFRDGTSGNAIEELSSPAPLGLFAALVRACQQLREGIYDEADVGEQQERAEALEVHISLRNAA